MLTFSEHALLNYQKLQGVTAPLRSSDAFPSLSCGVKLAHKIARRSLLPSRGLQRRFLPLMPRTFDQCFPACHLALSCKDCPLIWSEYLNSSLATFKVQFTPISLPVIIKVQRRTRPPRSLPPPFKFQFRPFSLNIAE